MNSPNDIDDFRTKEELEKQVLMLERENKAAMLTITKLLKDLNKKCEQIAHLESLVTHNVPVIRQEDKKIIIEITPESEIADLQLERLRTSAKTRILTLEETRMYDLLVKNKRLSQDESTINLSKSNYRDVTDTELLNLAQIKLSDGNEPDNT